MTEPWQRVLQRVAARTRLSFDAGTGRVRRRARPPSVRAALHVARRHAHSRAARSRSATTCSCPGPTLGIADAPSLLWRALTWNGAEERDRGLPRPDNEPGDELLLFVPGAARRQAQRHRRRVGFLPRRRRCGGRAGRERSRGRRSRSGATKSRACTEGREPLDAAGKARWRRSSSKFALPRSAFEDLIDGVAMDLQRSAVRHIRGAAAVLSARGVGGRPDLRRDFRVSRCADARLRDRSRHRPAADEHHPRRRARSRARPRCTFRPRICSGSAAPRMTCGRAS